MKPAQNDVWKIAFSVFAKLPFADAVQIKLTNNKRNIFFAGGGATGWWGGYVHEYTKPSSLLSILDHD